MSFPTLFCKTCRILGFNVQLVLNWFVLAIGGSYWLTTLLLILSLYISNTTQMVGRYMITPSHHTQLPFSSLLNSQKNYSVSAHVHSGHLFKFPEYSAGFLESKDGEKLIRRGRLFEEGNLFHSSEFQP